MKYNEYKILVGVHFKIIRHVLRLGFDAELRFNNGSLFTSIAGILRFQVIPGVEPFHLWHPGKSAFVVGAYGDLDECKRAITRVLECADYREQDFTYNIEDAIPSTVYGLFAESDEEKQWLADRILSDLRAEWIASNEDVYY